MLKDIATLTIDASGVGLHKRGYRVDQGEAPLKETLAASLIKLTNWKPDRPFVDPFCGSGTIPIEAALIDKISHQVLTVVLHRMSGAGLVNKTGVKLVKK